ncbi:hypothetical protein [Micromonospora profundi]|uniref:hypothetical protein n=1 Tax=Micromonospora profundi TaxID=1420889 RepID=UPI0036638073
MGTPLATAFVRIRPDTTGFQRETERDADRAGDKAGASFGNSFGRTLNSKASTVFSSFRKASESATDGAGAAAGRKFGDDFIKDAASSLRAARSRFAAEGAQSGSVFGDGFVRDAADRLRAARGRFGAEGRESGDGFSRAFRSGVLPATAGVSGLISVGVALGPAIIPVAAATAAAIGGIGVAATAAFAGIGVGILAFSGVADAVKAMGAAQDSAAKDGAALSRSHSAVASAADGVRNAEQSLARTREQVAESSQQSARRVADAERDLTRAQQDARDVARELNEAREQARQRLDDLTSSVQQNALSQRQANLDVAKAKADLDKVLTNPLTTKTQREQAQITYEREVLQLEDLKRRGVELSADQQKAAKAGVEGSREVAAARKRIADADERVAQAQQSVTDARREQQKQERDGAYQVRAAQQALVSAQRSLRDATVATGVAGSAAMTKLKDAMDGLSPAGQKFAKFIFGLKDEFRSLRDAAQGGLLPGAQKAIERLLPYLPQVRKFVGDIATTMGDLAVKTADAFTSPEWKKFFGLIADTAGPALTGMFDATMNVATGFANLIRAFSPLNKDLGTGVVGLTQKFADWSAGLGESKGFQSFLGYVREFGPIAVKFFGDLFKVTGKLLVALAPLGGILLAGLGKLADFLAKLDPGVLIAVAAGIGAVVAIAGGPLVAAVVGVVAAAGGIYYALNRLGLLKPLIAAVTAAVSWAWERVLKPAFFGLKDVILNQVVPAVMWLWRNVIQPAFAGIAAAVSWAWGNVIQPAFAAIRWYVSNVLGPLFTWLWKNVISPVWTGIRVAISVAWALIKVVFGLMQVYIKTVLAPLFTWLWKNVIGPTWNGIKATISGVWEKGIKPVFNLLAGFIEKNIVPAFKTGVSAIGKAWEGLKAVAKIPVKFVVDTVINSAIIDNYNKIAKVFGVDTVDRVSLPKGFARGGVLPGYTPGKDVHRFVSPSGGALDLSGGEAVIRPEGTRALGRGWVDGINRAARSGGVGGVQRFLGGFADGGILGRLGKAASAAKKKATDVISGVGSFVTDPAGTLQRLADKVISLVPGGGSAFGRLATGMPRKVVKFITDKIGGFFRSGEDGGRGVAGSSPLGGSAGMMQTLRAIFPGLRLISGFRPNSMTLTGNRSYHASNRAVDVPPIRSVAEYISKNMRSVTRELITPWPEFNLLNGRPHRYTGAVWNQHNFAGGNAHNHWAARLGGVIPPMPAQLFDSGGDWRSGTIGVNMSGRTEHVSTGASMDLVARLLEGVRGDLRDLRTAVTRVAPGVGAEINATTTAAIRHGRTITPVTT